MRCGLNNSGYAAFFDALIDGRLRLGQTITQEELCAVLGLSLSRMRAVTVLLEAEGLVQIRKRLGLTIFYPDVGFVGGTFQFREILETEGIQRFTEMVTDDWLQGMTEAHHEMIAFVAKRSDPKVYATPVRQIERAFHDSFIDALGNEQIAINYRRNSEKMYLLRLLNPDAVGPSNTIKSMQEHLAVIDALGRRDAAAAAEALQRHITGVLHRILTH